MARTRAPLAATPRTPIGALARLLLALILVLAAGPMRVATASILSCQGGTLILAATGSLADHTAHLHHHAQAADEQADRSLPAPPHAGHDCLQCALHCLAQAVLPSPPAGKAEACRPHFDRRIEPELTGGSIAPLPRPPNPA